MIQFAIVSVFVADVVAIVNTDDDDCQLTQIPQMVMVMMVLPPLFREASPRSSSVRPPRSGES